MRTTVRFHDSAKPSYDAWIKSIRNSALGGPKYAQLFEAELIAELERTEGLPAGFRPIPGLPGYFFWRFNRHTWVRYQIRSHRYGLLHRRGRLVLILSIERTPPA